MWERLFLKDLPGNFETARNRIRTQMFGGHLPYLSFCSFWCLPTSNLNSLWCCTIFPCAFRAHTWPICMHVSISIKCPISQACAIFLLLSCMAECCGEKKGRAERVWALHIVRYVTSIAHAVKTRVVGIAGFTGRSLWALKGVLRPKRLRNWLGCLIHLKF